MFFLYQSEWYMEPKPQQVMHSPLLLAAICNLQCICQCFSFAPIPNYVATWWHCQTHNHVHTYTHTYIQLKHDRKIVYTRHRCFLKPYHPYKRLKKAFNGSQEHETPPISLTGEQVFPIWEFVVWRSAETRAGKT